MRGIVLLIMMVLFSSCDELLNDSVSIEGCMDPNACGYNPDATIQSDHSLACQYYGILDGSLGDYDCGDLQVLQDIIDANNLNAEPLELGCDWQVYYSEDIISRQTWNQEGRLTEIILWGHENCMNGAQNQGIISVIPESIGNLSELELLIIQESSIESLPESIGDLINLRGLNLGYNYELTTLPESICNLQNLEGLSMEISGNPDWPDGGGLTSLPENIGNLSSLNSLRIYQNRLTSLPESICNLPSSCDINLAYNHICRKYQYECLDKFSSEDYESGYWYSQNLSNCCEGLNDDGEIEGNWEECENEE